ncbi:MAG TPA: RDD family protein [Puia sp.]
MSDVQQNILSDFIEQPESAKFGKRIAAAMVDGLIILIILIIMGNLFGDRYEATTVTTTVSSTTEPGKSTTNREVETSSGFHLSGWPAFGYMVCWFFIIPFMEGKTGQTIGKKALAIRVIRKNGDPSTIGSSFVRHLFDCVDCFLLIGILVAVSNEKRARIGDLVAGTYVVDKVS